MNASSADLKGCNGSNAQGRAILGLQVQVHTFSSAAEELTRRASLQIPTKVAFANANLVNCARRDPPLMKSLQDFFILNDGAGVNIASKILYGRGFPANLNGTDFTPYYLSETVRSSRIFLIGARPEVISKAMAIMSARWPDHTWVGCHDGYFAKEEWPMIAEKIAASQPDLVLVGLGNGLQEKLMDQIVPLCSAQAWGVGALFDFMAGRVGRAPSWMRRVGLEWVYRLLIEPRRLWQRYLVGNFQFLASVLRAKIV